jgi:hypothetical protein
MKLRYFQTYGRYHEDSDVELQYWDDEVKRWEPVPFVRVPYHLKEDYMIEKEGERIV